MSTKTIIDQVVYYARKKVINQARYIYPSADVNDMENDIMYESADNMTDEQTAAFLKGKDIVSEQSLIGLIDKVGVESLYHESHWIDVVATYIVDNKKDCKELWNHLLTSH